MARPATGLLLGTPLLLAALLLLQLAVEPGLCANGDEWLERRLLSKTAVATCPANESVPRPPDRRCLPCGAPSGVDPCTMNASTCGVIAPGGNCTVFCVPPFEGAAAIARCPADNTDAMREVSWVPPTCSTWNCSEPESLPEGYQRSAGSPSGLLATFECSRGFAGSVRTQCGADNETCAAVLQFDGCSRIVPCVPLVLDPCMYNRSGCDYVEPGEFCPVTCQAPYTGASTVASCPAGNTNPEQELIVPYLPACTLTCSEPEAPPEGYTQVQLTLKYSRWECAEGFRGLVKQQCVINEACQSSLVLSNCWKLQPCAPIAVEEKDACRFDASECGAVQPGSTCEVRCRSPFVGGVQGSCVQDNINASTPVVWQRPNCALVCPDPFEVPAGYVKGPTGTWRCAPGHDGLAALSCDVAAAPSCSVEAELAGCSQTSPCWAPAAVTDPCMLDVSACYLLEPGRSCTVRCKAPFVGGSMQATCPSGNRDPWRMVNITPPDCTLQCPEPRPIPDGYVKNASSSSGWACSEGYVGQARGTCSHNRDCAATSLSLGGCSPQPPCPVPEVPDKLAGCLDLSDCVDTPAGSECRVKCASPFAGAPTVAVCPYGTTGGMNLTWTAADCVLGFQCPDPPGAAPEGYWKDERGWKCKTTLGFFGEAKLQCESDCRVVRSWLSGCSTMSGCMPLETTRCDTDVSACSRVPPGGSCPVYCKAPHFVGTTTYASCPSGNLDAMMNLTWTPPNCTFNCPAPDWREGYAWASGGWECASGFYGKVELVCKLEEDCEVQRSVLTGCDRLQACLPLVLNESTRCRMDASSCARVPSAGECSVRCRPPYEGVPTVATCARQNINSSLPLVVSGLPVCYCPDPVNIPLGYEKIAGGWQCAEGWLGVPVKRCEGEFSCLSSPTLTGCAPIVPCAPILADTCEIDVSNCTNVMPGGSCRVSCRAPYYGESVVAQCPLDNADPKRPVEWTSPQCVLQDCPNVGAVPEGYARAERGWACAEGYTGEVAIGCTTASKCQTEPVLSGCVPVKECRLPTLDPCRFNLSRCDGVLAGQTCNVGCAGPFAGSTARATCDLTSYLPDVPQDLPWALPLSYKLPNCSAKACLDPLPIPFGYAKTAAGWRCADGWLGTAVPTCHLDKRCGQLPFVLSGCSPPVPCLPPPMDKASMCGADLTRCFEIPGGSACVATCKEPYTGTAKTAVCPAGNIDRKRLMTWVDGPPVCVLADCLDPLPERVPRGYRKTDAGWQCDPFAGKAGYAGDVKGCCNVTEQDCSPRLVLYGCVPVETCTVPALDKCMYDNSLCSSVLPGGGCVLHCKRPYVGVDPAAGCPDRNRSACLEGGVADANCCSDAAAGGCQNGYTFSQLDLCAGYDPWDQVRHTCCQPTSLCPTRIYGLGNKLDWPPQRCERNSQGYWAAPGQLGYQPTPPRLPLEYFLPSCMCLDPPVIPKGYVKVNSEWVCSKALEYTGVALLMCREISGCSKDPFSKLTGCLPIVPCVGAPSLGCRVNASSCNNVSSGSSCEISCRAPYSGVGTIATCPEDNTDPLRAVEWPPSWSSEQCLLECGDPSAEPYLPKGWRYLPPDGYALTAASYPGCGSTFPCLQDWSCAAGWSGKVSFNCTFDVANDCAVTSEPIGCIRLGSCFFPQSLNQSKSQNQCMYNFTDCEGSVISGGSCQIQCMAPFAGDPTRATCREQITVPEELQVVLPECGCLPNCALREGYSFQRTEFWPSVKGEYDCLEGLVGEPRWACSRGAECLEEAELQGCEPLQTCTAPSAARSNSTWPRLPVRLLAAVDVGEAEAQEVAVFDGVAAPARDGEAAGRLLSNEPGLQVYGAPLGVAWGLRTLTSSSVPASGCCQPAAGRLYFTGGGGGWCASAEAWNASWLQVDLGAVVQVNSVATQGRSSDDQWTSVFRVSTSLDGEAWDAALAEGGSEDFVGNADRSSVVVSRFASARPARFVRFFPRNGTLLDTKRDGNKTTLAPCLRVEVYQAIRVDGWLPKDIDWFAPGESVVDLPSWWVSDVARGGDGDPLAAFTPGSLLAGGLWVSAVNQLTNQWFILDLLDSINVDGLRLQGEQDDEEGLCAPKAMRLQTASYFDGPWRDVISFTGSQTGATEVALPAAALGRFWQLRVDSTWCDGPGSLAISTFQLRGKRLPEWAQLPDQHLQPPCNFREVRFSAGGYDSAAACLAQARLLPQIDYVVWRGDDGNNCWACDVSHRGGELTTITLSGAVSFTARDSTCAAPTGITNVAPQGACQEGFYVNLGTSCTTRCAPGFRPSIASLPCGPGGELSPSAFACLAICPTLSEQPFCEEALAEYLSNHSGASRCEALAEVRKFPDTFASPGGGADVYCGLAGCCGCPGRCSKCHLGLQECATTTTTTQGCSDDDYAVALAAQSDPTFPASSCEAAVPYCFHPEVGPLLRRACRISCGTCDALRGCPSGKEAECLGEELSWGLCSLDLSDCSSVDAGGTCQVRCREPFVGEPVNVSCPVGNIDPTILLQGALPRCEPGSCGDPSPVPLGYEKNASGWRCMDGWVGEPHFGCAVQGTCVVDPVPTGCLKRVGCKMPEVEACELDLSNCTFVPAGQSCQILCLVPYDGEPTTAYCDPDNTNPDGLQWSRPFCRTYACPDPVAEPLGYARKAMPDDSAWECAMGFVGNVDKWCNYTFDCEASTVENCSTYRAVAEDEDYGNWTPPVCFPEVMQLHGCTEKTSCVTCPQPASDPEGYARTASGDWYCAPGFAGKPQVFCPSCGSEAQLTGCSPIVGCVVPQVNQCMFDVSTCWGIDSGQTCEVVVREPFVGNTTVATCPPNNTNPSKQVVWTPPITECPNPEVTPVGYSLTGALWHCSSDHAGTAVKRCQLPNGTCIADVELLGCFPKRPCVAPQPPDPCRYNVSLCSTLPAGAKCNITCEEPYWGTPSTASCPGDNIDPTTVVNMSTGWPSCEFRCPRPLEPIDGYEQAADSINYRCSEDYAGEARAVCSIDEDCYVIPTNMTGCLPIVGCPVPNLDQCEFDLSSCANLSAGANCSIGCLAPYYKFVFGAGVAQCPWNNTDATAPPANTTPLCELDCPDPDSIPAGYVEINGRWRCDTEYGGFAKLSCRRAGAFPNCTVISNLSGCSPKVPCIAPSLDYCMIDRCDTLGPGQKCLLECKLPYVGNPANGTCPPSNIYQNFVYSYSMPSCVLQCDRPEGDAIPEGYMWNSTTENWFCSDGWIGDADFECKIDYDCWPYTVFSGCRKLVPCSLPVYDTCMYNMTDCIGLLPGDSCNISCRYPFRGDSMTNGSCPADNTDPARPFNWTAPLCTCKSLLGSEAPQMNVPGSPYYWYAFDDKWLCSDGYGGNVSIVCKNSTGGCVDEAELSGCVPTVPCAKPVPQDCFVNTSNCSNVPPGGSCTLTCSPPYWGNATTATCPLKNIDPKGPLGWSVPSCQCPEPALQPTGYVRGAAGWECQDDWEGSAQLMCPPGAGCQPDVQVGGCKPLLPCNLPAKVGDAVIYPCLYDVGACSNTFCGFDDPPPVCFCNPSCKAPYTGDLGLARCTQGNTAPNVSLDFIRVPTCALLTCPPPTTLPAGFIWDENGKLVCDVANGYTGTAYTTCWNTKDYCTVTVTPKGCLLLLPCLIPDHDPCVYDFSDCDANKTTPSSKCEVACRPPYVGVTVNASCRDLNVNSWTRLTWTKQTCVCPDPCPVIPGYARAATTMGWQCAAGYTGVAEKRCQRPNSTCIVEPELVACTKIEPCAPLVIPGCSLDLANCTNVGAGQSCVMRCRGPYEGNSSIASCPVDNTDPFRMPNFTALPSCALRTCPDLHPVPVGYVKSGRGWRCDEGFGGQPFVNCGFDKQCALKEFPSGCLPLRPCAPLVMDPCIFDTTACEMMDGGEKCLVHCRPPFVGTPTRARCPAANTDPLQQLMHAPPVCACPDPETPPPGYIKVDGNWVCDEENGYAGYGVSHFCSDGNTCYDKPQLTGCTFSRVPCVPPVLAQELSCSYDVSECDGVLPGNECQIKCVWPYTGDPGMARCKLANTDPLTQAVPVRADVWQVCKLKYESCVDPLPIPVGYVKTPTGWQCDSGWNGTASALCGPWEDCRAPLSPVGCKSTNRTWSVCSPPSVLPRERCRFDLSDCAAATPGTSCQVRCRAPFTGRPNVAVCPPDGDGTLRWSPPRCDMEHCPAPEPTPAGYRRGAADGSWRCDAGYVGAAVAYCRLDISKCTATLQLSGCISDEAAQNATIPFVYPALNATIPGETCREQPAKACGDPAVAPPGYRRLRDGWSCRTGYKGTPTKRCMPKRECWALPTLSGCVSLQPCGPLTTTIVAQVSSCEIDTSDCPQSLNFGQSCPLRCRPPFTGPPGQAWCPAGNTELGTPPNVTLPQCRLDTCSEKNPVPAGYVKTSGGWTCALGWNGTANVQCTLGLGCLVTCNATGCGQNVLPARPPTTRPPQRLLEDVPRVLEEAVPATEAGALDEAAASRSEEEPESSPSRSLQSSRQCKQAVNPDVCMFAFASSCATLVLRASCAVTCKAPYLGDPGWASCTAAGKEPVMLWPTCTCPDPVATPAGYVKVDGQWMCDPETHVGNASLICKNNNGTCFSELVPVPELVGCMQLRDCVLPRGCTYSLLNCSRMLPGSTCEVGCNSPSYVGSGTALVTCPEGNTDALLIAEELSPLPLCGIRCGAGGRPGYTPRLDGTWAEFDCMDGWVGSGSVTCSVDPGTCVVTPSFSGCTELCVLPPLDLCRFNASECQGVPRGASCTLNCQDGLLLVGSKATWRCPANESLPNSFIGQYPRCIQQYCPEPAAASVPPSFVNKDGTWVCAPGFAGLPVVQCDRNPVDCAPRLSFAGCHPAQSCSLPEVDPCAVDVSDCWNLPSGATCKVQCIVPFVGNVSVGLCPSGNTDPTQAVLLNNTVCTCPDPNPLPPGYRRRVDGTWECTSGFLGTAEKLCREASTCFTAPLLRGCDKLTPCKTPTTDDCRYDLTNCSEVLGNTSCEVACRFPYAGDPTTASCVDGNINESAPIPWEADAPVCVLQCPDPAPGEISTGYVKGADGTWSCTEDGIGQAIWSCRVVEGSCAVIHSFNGCIPKAACRTPLLDPCEFYAPSCSNVGSGRSCVISCKAPYVGVNATAVCIENNIDATKGLDFDLPVCTSAACPEPDFLPPGYVQQYLGYYECDSGYAGVARKVCRHVGRNCTLLPFMEGCKKIVPCRLLTTQDPCQYDVAACTKVNPGSTCRIRCKIPFVGDETVGYCLPGNIDESNLQFKLPTCAIGQGWDPLPVATGYMRTSSGWSCAPSFSGRLKLQCDVLENCATEIMPFGCGPVFPCGAEPFEDTDTRQGFISGTVSFGQAQLGENVSAENVVDSYGVYFADNCNRTLGEAVASVNVSVAKPSCCDSGAYSLQFSALALPEGADHFVVVARTSSVNVTSQERHGAVVRFQDLVVLPQQSAARDRGLAFLTFGVVGLATTLGGA